MCETLQCIKETTDIITALPTLNNRMYNDLRVKLNSKLLRLIENYRFINKHKPVFKVKTKAKPKLKLKLDANLEITDFEIPTWNSESLEIPEDCWNPVEATSSASIAKVSSISPLKPQQTFGNLTLYMASNSFKLIYDNMKIELTKINHYLHEYSRSRQLILDTSCIHLYFNVPMYILLQSNDDKLLCSTCIIYKKDIGNIAMAVLNSGKYEVVLESIYNMNFSLYNVCKKAKFSIYLYEADVSHILEKLAYCKILIENLKNLEAEQYVL